MAPAARAGVSVQIDGLDGELRSAALAHVELAEYADRDVSAAQVRRLYARAPEQIAAALEAYGYYEPQVDGELHEAPGGWTARFAVRRGEPVRVTALDIALADPARGLAAVRTALAAFAPRLGEPFEHAAYERSKAAIQAALLANGFLDAHLLPTTPRVEVSRAAHSARIRLAWDTGTRYRIGTVHFEGAPFPDTFLARYVPWESGAEYAQERLLALQRRLADTDYFAGVEVTPEIDQARDGIVPIRVVLIPAKRSVYTGGLFVGTDTGFGGRVGLERRWMNARGHKLKAEAILAQRLETVTAQYLIPLPGPDDRSFNFGANFKKETTASSTSRTASLVANETRQWLGFTRTLGLHALSGNFEIAGRHGQSTVLFPEIGLVRKRADDPAFVRDGYALTLLARAARRGLIADTSFVQVRADAKWIHGFSERQRVILRGSLGATRVDDFSALPPDLRFFAGGDRSIRGYGYQAIGPRQPNPRSQKPETVGGTHLAVASVEYEYYFRRDWGVAAFVDAGDAFFDRAFSAKVGAGLGLRWRSPVGMLRLDVATPIRDRDERGLKLHLVIGPDL